jgi:outer membrane protein TolC
LCSSLFSNELELLQKDKQEIRTLEKQIIEEKYKSSKNEWIGGIDLSSTINRSHSFSRENDNLSKSISIGFSQNIYKSGGIEFSIQNAKDTYNQDLIAWENENIAILQTIYEILLNMKKVKIQIAQSDYNLKNKHIELILKKIEYEAGKVDIVELNNAIMSKNTQFKDTISLKNSLKDLEHELSKYTSLRYDEIEILDFKHINKEEFIKNSLDLKYEKSKIDVLNTTYKELKSSYGPQVSLSTNASYSNDDDLTNNTNDDSSSGSISLKLSMPIFDITKDTKIEKSKLEVLKQKVSLNDTKNELLYTYEQIINQIDTYEQYRKTISENLELYNDLISVNATSNSAGMTSDYDLEILKNTKQINEYDLIINDINIKLQYSKLYFMTKAKS